MLLHQKSKHVDAGDLLIGIVLTIVCLDQRGESFDETVSAVLRIVADLVHQFTQLFYRGIVFALVSGNNEQTQFLRAGNPARDCLSSFPLAGVVFPMRKNITNIEYLSVEVDGCDQSVFVSCDIEDVVRHASAAPFYQHQINGTKSGFQIGRIVKPSILQESQPGIQGRSSLREFSGELPKPSRRNRAHAPLAVSHFKDCHLRMVVTWSGPLAPRAWVSYKRASVYR